jgi:uncharacterized protein (DUF4213/DUF364 family)
MLIDEICDRLLPVAATHRVAEVRIGLGYTAVRLDNDRCGLAFTFRQESGGGCCAMKEAGTLAGRRASELVVQAKSLDVIAAAVGLATMNALIEPPASTGGDVLDLVAEEKTDTVGMVGYFGPLVEPLRKRAKALHIIERRSLQGGVLPEQTAGDILPQCQIVILTATSLLNRTLDGLLGQCCGAREIVLLGPSTPLLPEVFATRGVTLLLGIEVIDPVQAMQVISEGGGTRQLLHATRKIATRTSATRTVASQNA